MGVVINKQAKDEAAESTDVKFLIQDAGDLSVKIVELSEQRQAMYVEIAYKLCPYKVGQVIKTPEGLGKGGLHIAEVVSPKEPGDGNWWQLDCFALSKAGEITKRYVSVTHAEVEAGLKVEVVK